MLIINQIKFKLEKQKNDQHIEGQMRIYDFLFK